MDMLLNLDLDTYNRIVTVWAVMGVLTALAIRFTGLMPMSNRADNSALAFLGTIDKRLGWIIMETPVLVAVIFFYAIGDNPVNVSVVILGAFVVHYINRALIFPYRIKVKGKTMPVSMVLASMLFYIINGYLIGYYLGSLRVYPLEWLGDPRFLLGAALFIAGFAINVTSDNILINLRRPGESGYRIPRGGFFRYVSCPNYFGEIVEWLGFALMSWSLIGTVYALWVALPLIAQGLGAHRWYREQFGEDYPRERRAVIPYLL